MISIIIPAFNEAKYIKKTLLELKGYIDNYSDVEIIVVNNGSQDDTGKIAHQFSWVKVIDLPSAVTIAEARNIGVVHSSGEFLSFIDADIIVTKDWWDALTEYSQQYSEKLIVSGFKVSISIDPSWVELNWFLNFKNSYSGYINSGNLVCSKKTFRLVGGFNKNLKTGEDVDFCHRALARGVNVTPEKKFRVHHEGYPKTLKAFFLRERWHGIGDVQTVKNFLKSKVAVVSTAVVFFSMILVFLLAFQFYYLALLISLLVFSLNLFGVLSRFKITSLKQLTICFFLNYIYFLARFLSVFEIFKDGARSR